ncbi:MAG: MotA/TolQ/ExbB proton channel family protein [Pseudomonadota bacterium]
MNALAGFDNPIVWSILLVAIWAFVWLFELLLYRPRDAAWLGRCGESMAPLRTLVGILPLLGLLGTIVGLLDTFERMSVDHGFDPTTLVSGGIADAMLTTKLGLLMVVPGWVALTYLQSLMDAVGHNVEA